jgi:uncharacterized membrane protein
MSNLEREAPPLLPSIGCLTLALAMLALCLMPFFLVDVMLAALERLHLTPQLAVLTLTGIVLGSLVNIPVYRIERDEEQLIDVAAVFGVGRWIPYFRRVRRDTIIAVNLGGCVIPSALAAWEVLHMIRVGGWPLIALAIVATANVATCYRVAWPVPGVGIAMPGFISPLVTVGLSWLLLMPSEFDPIRAPTAFIAGVLGPLIGADLLHLKDITKISAGIASIGGAGTFDGIVLSGILAALLT